MIQGTKGLFIGLLVQAFASIAAAQTNQWTSPVTGNWHDSTWSLLVQPAITQSAIMVTNAGSKAVLIGPVTRNNFPGSMVVSNLTVAGTPNSTNTVVLNFTGPQVPFQIWNRATIGSNGVLLNLESILQLNGASASLFINGGSVNQSGGTNSLVEPVMLVRPTMAVTT